MKLKKKKAFTLTELLIVVMVLGVLAAVAVPKFSKVLETQKTTEAEELMAAVRTEQEKRCLLDKPYLADLAELKDIIPQTESKNYSYSQIDGGVGILASSKGKYNYSLSMPSYRDGRICCEGEECEKLNKDYPLCKDLGEIEVGYECASEVVSPDLNPPPPAGCPEEEKPAVSTRNCIEGCGTETTVISCQDGKWHEEWVGNCQTQPTTTQTKACRSYDSKYCSGTAKTQWQCQGTGEQRAWKEVWNTSDCSRCSSGGGGGGSGTPTKATFIVLSSGVYLPKHVKTCGNSCGRKIETSGSSINLGRCDSVAKAYEYCAGSSGRIGCIPSSASTSVSDTECEYYSSPNSYTCYDRNVDCWRGTFQDYVCSTFKCIGTLKSETYMGQSYIYVKSDCSQSGGFASDFQYECYHDSNSAQKASCTAKGYNSISGYICSDAGGAGSVGTLSTCPAVEDTYCGGAGACGLTGCGALDSCGAYGCGGATFCGW